MTERKKETVETTEPKFTKEQLLGSDKYQFQLDLVNAVLSDDTNYTIAETDKLIENFLDKGVK